MKNFKSSSFYSVVLMSLWFCISCSHTRTDKAQLEGGLSDEASVSGQDTSAQPEARADETGVTQEIAVAEVSSADDSVESSAGVEPSADLAATSSEVSGDNNVGGELKLADATTATATSTIPEPTVTLDGSEAGFMTPEKVAGETVSGSSTDTTPEATTNNEPVLNVGSTATTTEPVKPKASTSTKRKPSSNYAPNPEKRVEFIAPVPSPAPAAAPVNPAPGPVAKVDNAAAEAAMKDALGEEDPKDTAKEEVKGEKLASAEIGSFIERHLLLLGIACVAFFVLAFVWMKRNRNQQDIQI